MERNGMEKIYMEKESVARLVVNAVILLVSLFSLVVICIEHHRGIPLPQFVTNRNLQNLFLKISSANDKVKWINIEKTF